MSSYVNVFSFNSYQKLRIKTIPKDCLNRDERQITTSFKEVHIYT